MDKHTIAQSATTGVEPPPNAPQEISQPLVAGAGHMRRPQPGDPAYETYQQLLDKVDDRPRELAPLLYERAAGAPVDHSGSGPATGGIAESVDAARAGKLDPFYATLAAQPAAQPAALSTDAVAMTGAKVTVAMLAPPPVKGRISRTTRLVPAQPAAQRPAVPSTGDPLNDMARLADWTPGDTLPVDTGAVRAADATIESPRQITQPAGSTGPSATDGSDAPPVQYVGDDFRPAALPGPIDLRTALPAAPAASDTDSPSRGQVRNDIAAGKQITGGFADQAQLQYFALDGRELGLLAQDMLVELHARVENDLRFNEAITYPRVSIKCSIEVSGYGMDNSFTVDKIVHDGVSAGGAPQTPIELAREVADEIAFVLIAAKSETDVDGQPLDPPDKIRVELNLRRPRKQIIVGPGGSRQMVDVVG